MSSDETVFHIILFLLAFCIFMSNLIVLMAIIKCKHLHIPSNIFVAGMALADLSVGAIGLPLRYVASLHLKLDFHICLYVNCIYLYSLDISLYMLLAFTFDRFYAIRFPFRYQEKVDCKAAIIAISVVWVLGGLLAYGPNLMVEDNHHEIYDGTCSFRTVVTPAYLVYVSFFVIFLGTLLIMIIVNTYILFVVRRHKRRMTRTNSVGGNPVRKRDFKALKMLICMTAALFLCCLPLNIYNLVWHFDARPGLILYRALMIIYYLNSLLNPFIYAVSNKRIKMACINVVMCRPLNDNVRAARTSSLECRTINVTRTSMSKSSADSEPKEKLKTELTTSFPMERFSWMTTPSGGRSPKSPQGRRPTPWISKTKTSLN